MPIEIPWLTASPVNFERFVRSASRSRSPEKEIAQLLRAPETELSYVSPLWDPVGARYVCWEGHQMFQQGELGDYGDDGFSCDFCGKFVSSANFAPFLHCPTCESDICGDCADEIKATQRFHRRCQRCTRCQGFVPLRGGTHICPAVVSNRSPHTGATTTTTGTATRTGTTCATEPRDSTGSVSTIGIRRSFPPVPSSTTTATADSASRSSALATPVRGVPLTRKRSRDQRDTEEGGDTPAAKPPTATRGSPADNAAELPQIVSRSHPVVEVRIEGLPSSTSISTLQSLCSDVEGVSELPTISFDMDLGVASLKFTSQVEADNLIQQTKGRTVNGMLPRWKWILHSPSKRRGEV